MQRSQKLALAFVATGLSIAILILVLFSKAPEPDWVSTGSNVVDRKSNDATHTLKPLIVQDVPLEGDGGLPSAAPQATNSNSAPDEPQSPQAADIVEDQIYERLQLQSRYFFRCYHHLLEVDPNQKGKLVVGFAIDPEGEPQLVQITQSDFENQAFHRCIIDVVVRTSFPKRPGFGSISTLFPLEFE